MIYKAFLMLLGASSANTFFDELMHNDEVKPYTQIFKELYEMRDSGELEKISPDAFKSLEFLTNKYGFLYE